MAIVGRVARELVDSERGHTLYSMGGADLTAANARARCGQVLLLVQLGGRGVEGEDRLVHSTGLTGSRYGGWYCVVGCDGWLV